MSAAAHIDPQAAPDLGAILSVLQANQDKNFVQRILNPSAYPTLQLGDGWIATHLMSWSEGDGKYFVYPHVVWDREAQSLRQLSNEEAWPYARRTGEFIEVESPEQADALSRYYKEAVPAFRDFLERRRAPGGPLIDAQAGGLSQ